MEAWKQIAMNALAGTDRQPFAAPQADGALGRALARTAREPGTRGLLAAAALAAAHAQAGQALEASPAKIEPAPADTLRQPSPALESLLFTILADASGTPRELLAEFLGLASQAGLGIPRRALPKALDAGARDRDLREALLPALDSRGRWLAAQKPEWNYAIGGGDEKAWEEGQFAARAAYLRALRKSDPARARETLEAGWKRESAQDRQGFLAQLEIGLSDADEPFLESALDDRGKDVRRLAANLLSRLPGSAFSRRAIARASLAVQIETKPLRKKLVVAPPESLDEAAKRDGLGADEPGLLGLGEKAKWLHATIASAPLAHWESALGQAPGELIELASKTDWEAALVSGWAAAAARQADKAWIAALLGGRAKKRHYSQRALLEALGREELEADALRLASDARGWDDLSERLELLPAPWGARLTAAVAGVLRPLQEKAGAADYSAQQGLMLLARRGDPRFYPEAERWAKEAAEAREELAKPLGKFIEVYSFRHSMHKEAQP